ncbi:MAG: DinB family protein [Bacteroidetes bacterium]|nr:DinB family protein [Bacteroidota bacterium]
MTIAKQLSEELQQQSANSKKVLERIPEAKLTWKPHEKSTQIGRLGMHIAELPNTIVRALETETFDFAASPFKPVFPNTAAEIIETFEKSLAKAVDALEKASDEQMAVVWKVTRGEQLIYEMPRSVVTRNTLNHIIHHRGQLTVYLRLLDIPVPGTFGPTADER